MKKRYKIEVDCANCATKMENAVRRVDGVNDASVNYMTQRFMLDSDDGVFDEVLKKAIKAMKSIEPDFEIEL